MKCLLCLLLLILISCGKKSENSSKKSSSQVESQQSQECAVNTVEKADTQTFEGIAELSYALSKECHLELNSILKLVDELERIKQ